MKAFDMLAFITQGIVYNSWDIAAILKIKII